MPEPSRDQLHGQRVAATAADRRQAYDDGVAAWHDQHDEPPTAHHDPHAIAECPLCNADGYTPANRICDHIDRTQTTARGRTLVQAELDKIRDRKITHTRGGAA